MAKLVPPHGKERKLMPLLLEGKELAEEKKRAQGLKKVKMTSRETSDCFMMGIAAFTPLKGFMTKADWQGVCDKYLMADGTFWPIPITLSVGKEDNVNVGDELALIDSDSDEIVATMKVAEKYTIDKAHECKQIFKTTDMEHPGVAKVMGQKEFNLAGPIKVLSEGEYPAKYGSLYARPAETRKIFEDNGWSTVAALQLRNPMHRSHEFCAKIALEIMDGVMVHQLVGALKAGDIPAEVRVKCIDAVLENYFPKGRTLSKVYPMEMRYGGPREALLHATFRQNYGCSHLIVGRDHAGVGDYYGPFDAHKIFDEIPKGSLETQPLKIDWTFYCKKCDGMASLKTCPHGKEDRVLLSGTVLRKTLSEGGKIPDHFGRDEALKILGDYYSSLTEKVEIKLHRAATGEETKK
jgi:sulfate adenylyltransferase